MTVHNKTWTKINGVSFDFMSTKKTALKGTNPINSTETPCYDRHIHLQMLSFQHPSPGGISMRLAVWSESQAKQRHKLFRLW